MASTVFSITLAFAIGSTGGLFHRNTREGGRIEGPGPGNGWGFPNGNPDEYGWHEIGDALPLGANRTPDYYFRRYYGAPAEQLYFPNYYNPYVSRGQRYILFAGCGGCHPAGGAPTGSAMLPEHPYNDTIGTGPRTTLPRFNGRVQAQPIISGGSGLTP